MERIRREILLLKDSDCPYVVKVIDFFDLHISGQLAKAVVYEHLSGGDLTKYLSPTSPLLTVDELKGIGLQMAIAIDHIWNWRKSRVVHRDIKPGNIVEATSGRYVLVDFGLSKYLDLSNITAAGLAPGTPGYMSPEQCLGRRSLSKSSDVFSLGITVYELATRRHPFNRDQNLIAAGADPPPLASVRQDIPKDFSDLIRRMLKSVPSQRPSDLVEEFSKL